MKNRKFIKIVRNIVAFPKGNCEQQSNNFNWIFYRHLERKYKRVVKDLPKYKSTGKFSNKVWWCWLQGEENAPDLNKACLKSLRRNLKDREIIIITQDNLRNYIEFPNFIIDKFNKGKISYAHFSDLIRTELLIKYGGTWIDSSVLCTNYNQEFFDKPLFMYKNYMRGDSSIVSSSWFITAEAENPILKTTRDLLYHYWERNNKLYHYFLFHFFFTMASQKYPELWNEVPTFSNVPPHILQFELLNKYSKERFDDYKKMSDFHKLNQKLDFTKSSETNYEYIIREYKKGE